MYIAVKPIQSHPFRQMCGLHVHNLIPLLFFYKNWSPNSVQSDLSSLEGPLALPSIGWSGLIIFSCRPAQYYITPGIISCWPAKYYIWYY